jgi:hypothetical protein
MRGALMGAMMMMATMPVIAAPNVTPVPVINDALANDVLATAEIEIAPIVMQAPAKFTHAIVTDVALDVIEIFAI